MRVFDSAMGILLGPSTDKQIALDLKALAETASECATHLHATRGRDYQGVIDFEHRGDELKDRAINYINSVFITSYNKGDVRRFAREIDLMINGSRKVAEHIRIWSPFIGELPEEAVTLLQKIESMAKMVRKIATMLCEGNASLAEVHALAERLDEAESEADAIRLAVEEKLAKEHSGPGSNAIALFAWITLYDILENITDTANHCGEAAVGLVDRKA
ncbi:MAG TPA: DUF47 family protein [Hyphomicrobiaceae bacterium]|jgi:uncharacterized protein Yka (UPF0111/DUF47 family)|nr:DUF47 family protein [Hyphomicrobiaceae bacterium]